MLRIEILPNQRYPGSASLEEAAKDRNPDNLPCITSEKNKGITNQSGLYPFVTSTGIVQTLRQLTEAELRN